LVEHLTFNRQDDVVFFQRLAGVGRFGVDFSPSRA